MITAPQAIEQSRRLLLCLHAKPDGDSVGSNLAMALALASLGKQVLVVSADPLPDIYSFLPGAQAIGSWQQATPGAYDAVLALDCAEAERTGAPLDLHSYAPLVINVDHHRTNPRFGDVNLVDPAAAAAGELVMDLLDGLHVVIDQEIALCLYTAIATDTGRFSYDSTTAETHRKAARLLDAGVDVGEVTTRVYESLPLATLHLLGMALTSLSVHAAGQIAVMRLDAASVQRAALSGRDGESYEIVGFARSVRSAKVGVLLREEEGKVRVSLRARPGVDVSQVAHDLGGGGHPQAAGITLSDCTVEEAEAILVHRLADMLTQA
jgi:phosphoesterase RecJ-like protein